MELINGETGKKNYLPILKSKRYFSGTLRINQLKNKKKKIVEDVIILVSKILIFFLQRFLMLCMASIGILWIFSITVVWHWINLHKEVLAIYVSF